MASPFRYRIFVEWSDEDEAFVARVPALGPGCMAHGATVESATHEVRTAADLMLEALEAKGQKTPEPDAESASFSGRVLLRLPKWLHAQLARRAQADGVSLNQELVALLAGGLSGKAKKAS